MEPLLNSKEVGRRIAELRKAKGMNQEDLAALIGLPRTTLTQIENGNRELSAIELKKLSEHLQFSADEFLSDEFNTSKDDVIDSEPDEEITEERISVPKLKSKKFRNILLYILERCAGKPNVGETVLYKLLYFCDFNFYEIYEEHLTGARYKKMTFGPVPQKMGSIVDNMISNGQLQKIKTEYFDKPQTRYLPLIKPDLKQFSAAEKEVIDSVLDQMSDWSAKMISDYSHNDKPWRATEVNDFIDYELAFYRRPPYSVRVYEEDDQNNI
jgi:transcriptional regulator with XRE-family HTH domain